MLALVEGRGCAEGADGGAMTTSCAVDDNDTGFEVDTGGGFAGALDELGVSTSIGVGAEPCCCALWTDDCAAEGAVTDAAVELDGTALPGVGAAVLDGAESFGRAGAGGKSISISDKLHAGQCMQLRERD